MKDPLKAHLKNIREAESLQKPCQVTSINPFEEIIICKPDPIKGSADDGSGNTVKDSFRQDLASDYSDATTGAASSENLDELVASLRQKYDHVVTIDGIADAVSHAVDDSVDESAAHYTWDYVIEQIASFRPAFDQSSDLDICLWRVTDLVSRFIKEEDPEVFEHLVQQHDPDVTLRELGDRLLDYFSANCAYRIGEQHFTPTFTKDRAFIASLELLTLGIQHALQDVDPSQSRCGFVIHHLNLVADFALDQAEEAHEVRRLRLMARVREIYHEHRSQFTSPTVDQEEEPNLSSAQKAKVFINALRERNDAGSLITTRILDQDDNVIGVSMKFESLVIYRGEDRKRLEELFDDFHSTDVRTMLKILDRCIQVHIEKITGRDEDKHKAFHAEKGRIIAYFCRYVETIAEELKTRYAFNYPRLLKG